MAETESKGAVKPSAEEILTQLVKALSQRKDYMNDAYSKATNPLDRLSLKDRMDEIDVVLGYLQGR